MKENSPENIDPSDKFLTKQTKQTKQTRLIILISVIGLLAFTLIATTFSFKDQLFQALYPKPQSLAVDSIDDLTNQLLQVSREYNMALTESGIEVTATPSATPSATDTPSSTPVSSSSPEPSPTPSVSPSPTPSPTSTSIIQPTVSGNTDTGSSVKGEKVSQKALQKQDEMVTIAKKRKDLLLEKMRSNPQEFLNKATLVNQRDSFPDEVKPYIEKNIQETGSLMIIHKDDFENKKSSYEYFLEKSNNKLTKDRFKLNFIKDPPKVFSGSEVTVDGIELDAQVALVTGNALVGQAGLHIITTAIIPPALGEQKTVVILVNFSDNPNDRPVTKQDTQNFVFANTNPSSINNY